jgi:mutator protein MutT
MKTFCIKCGVAHTQESFPKKCGCGHEMYINPIPVAVVIVPVENEGFLLIQRAIEPKIGEYAFPGGFVDAGESVEEAAFREVREEVGIELKSLELLSIQSPPNRNTVLVFYKSNVIKISEINFKANSEVSAIKVTQEPLELAFPIHTAMLKLVLKAS